MRLIDRDALHQTYMKWFKKESVNNQTVTKSITLADALMRGEPVIDAIPVEWIKDKIRMCLEMMKSDMFDCHTSINYSLTAQLLAQLLESWEEENDVSRIGK